MYEQEIVDATMLLQAANKRETDYSPMEVNDSAQADTCSEFSAMLLGMA
jgi:hypothetical protein